MRSCMSSSLSSISCSVAQDPVAPVPALSVNPSEQSKSQSPVTSVALPVLQNGEKEGSSSLSVSQVPVTKEPVPEAAPTAEKAATVTAAPSSPLAPEVSKKPDEEGKKVAEVASSDKVQGAEEAKKSDGIPLSKEEKIKMYVDRKKHEIDEFFTPWKKNFNPFPAAFLYNGASAVDGVVKIVTFGIANPKTKETVVKEAQALANSMISEFEKALKEVKTIAGLKKALVDIIEKMKSKESFVDTPTDEELKKAIAFGEGILLSLQPKKPSTQQA